MAKKKKTTKKKSNPAGKKKTAGKAGRTKKKTGKVTKKAARGSSTKKTAGKSKTKKSTTKKKVTKKKSTTGRKKTAKKSTSKKSTTKKPTRKKTSKKTTKKATGKAADGKKKSTRRKTTKKSTRGKDGSRRPTVAASDNGENSHTRKKKVLRKISDTAKREASEKNLTPEQIRAKAAAAIIPEAAPKKLKSPLSKRELKAFAELLLEKRAELVGDLTSMEAGALLGKDSANLSNMPQHMADIGSDNYEQELTLGLMESEREMLIEIDEALARINAGTFGVCEVTGEPISKARLEAKPWAKYSIEAARAMERGRRF